MLTRRLILDTIRRLWTVYAMAVGFIFVLSWLATQARHDGVDFRTVTDALMWSMVATWFLAFTPLTALEQREITRMPMSRREFWIARWCLAVAVPATLLAASVALATFVDPAIRGETIALTFLYCALYGGCFMALNAVLPVHRLASRPQGWKTNALITAYFIGVMVGGAWLPSVFAPYLPHTFAALRGPLLPMLIAAAGITVASYFYHPPITARASRPHWEKTDAPSDPHVVADRGLTGLSLMIWREARRTGLLLMCAIPGLFVFERFYDSSVTMTEFLRNGRALPFEGGFPEHIGVPVMMFLFIAGMPSNFSFITDLRRLRLVPWSTTQLAVTLTAIGPLFAVIFWVFLLLLHAVVVRSWPVTLRLDWLLAIAGGVALMQTLTLILPSSFSLASGIFVAPITVVFLTSTGFVDLKETILVAALGTTMLVASFLVNFWSLKHSSRIYKPRRTTLPFVGGVPDPNQR